MRLAPRYAVPRDELDAGGHGTLRGLMTRRQAPCGDLSTRSQDLAGPGNRELSGEQADGIAPSGKQSVSACATLQRTGGGVLTHIGSSARLDAYRLLI
jgi:hypothetical protein